MEKFVLSDQEKRSFDDRVMSAYMVFCNTKHVFPKIVGVSLSHAGYQTQILEVKIDRTLEPESFWLASK